MRGDVTDAGQTNKQQQLKIELLSQWKLEAVSRNLPMIFLKMGTKDGGEGSFAER